MTDRKRAAAVRWQRRQRDSLPLLAPLIAGWSGSIMPAWATVAVIAAYLAFFPVAVGMLRGLQSPSAAGAELMRSYAAGWWRTLVKLRFPAALPYLFPALRLAGAAAVVGIPHPRWGEVGVALVELRRGVATDEHDLIEHCRAELAAFKVPVRIGAVPAIPLVGIGKTDVVAVRALVEQLCLHEVEV